MSKQRSNVGKVGVIVLSFDGELETLKVVQLVTPLRFDSSKKLACPGVWRHDRQPQTHKALKRPAIGRAHHLSPWRKSVALL
jgi:hypothetical protein